MTDFNRKNQDPHADRAERLASLLIDGECSTAEWEELVDLLRMHASAQDRYLEFLAIHGHLVWRLDDRMPAAAQTGRSGVQAGGRVAVTAPSDATGTVAVPVGRFPVWPLGVVVVALLLAAGWWMFTRQAAPRSSPIVAGHVAAETPPIAVAPPAVLVRSLFAIWSAGQGVKEAEPLSLGQRLALQRGLAEVKFASGATVTLQGPAELTIVTANAARLESGQLTADVPPSAVGFTLDVPTGRVIDRGTRFGVIVEKSGEGKGSEVEVHVLKGVVEVETPASGSTGAALTKLTGNEALRGNSKTKSLERIPAAPDQFVSTLNEPITLRSGDIVVDGPGRTIRRVSDGAIFAPSVDMKNDIHALAFSADGTSLYAVANRWTGRFGPSSKLIRMAVSDPGHPGQVGEFRQWGSRLTGTPNRALLACDFSPSKKHPHVARLDPAQKYRGTVLAELPGDCTGLAVSSAGEIYVALARQFVARFDQATGALTPVVADVDPASLIVDLESGDLLIGVARPSGGMEIRRYRAADNYRLWGEPLLLPNRMTLRATTSDGMILATLDGGSGLWQIDPHLGERTQIYAHTVKALAIYRPTREAR